MNTLSRHELNLVRWAGIAGIAAALCWTVGDALILGSRTDLANTPVLAEYEAQIDSEMAAAMIGSSFERLAWGGLIAALTVPLYMAGGWHLFQGLKPAGKWLSVPPYLLMLCAWALSPLAHASFVYLGETYKTFLLVDPASRQALAGLAANISTVLIIDYAVLLVLMAAGLVWFTVAVATGRTRFPRWAAILNPVVLLVVGSALDLVLPEPLATWLSGAGFNLGFLMVFGLSTALLWNGGREAAAAEVPARAAA